MVRAWEYNFKKHHLILIGMIFGVSVSDQMAKGFRSHSSASKGFISIAGTASGTRFWLFAGEIPAAAGFRSPANRPKRGLRWGQ
jgi:hypothetical protein